MAASTPRTSSSAWPTAGAEAPWRPPGRKSVGHRDLTHAQADRRRREGRSDACAPRAGGVAAAFSLVAQLGPLIALLRVLLHHAERPVPQNFSLIIQQVMVVGTLAIGQTLIILTAGIDLSCGTVMALGSIVMTKLAVDNGVPAVLAILLGIARVRAAFGSSTAGWCRLSAAAVHRHARHAEHRVRADAHLLQRADDLEPAERDDVARDTFKIGGTAVTYGSW
jgi:hypothetical protein